MAKERRRAVLELLQRPGNARCADCGAPDPDWASYTLGVFICLSCSGIHRNIPQVSKVKSVRLDAWDEAQVEFLASHGNDAARARFESKVPSFYYRPTPSDCQLLREQWIRAKYERQEFIYPEKQEPYSAGYREGFLWKRGRDNGQFLSRKFVLTEREGALKYFNRNDAKEPKAVMKIEHLNATFQPAKIGHPHGLQVTYLKDNSTRNIFIYHEDGKVGASAHSGQGGTGGRALRLSGTRGRAFGLGSVGRQALSGCLDSVGRQALGLGGMRRQVLGCLGGWAQEGGHRVGSRGRHVQEAGSLPGPGCPGTGSPCCLWGHPACPRQWGLPAQARGSTTPTMPTGGLWGNWGPMGRRRGQQPALGLVWAVFLWLPLAWRWGGRVHPSFLEGLRGTQIKLPQKLSFCLWARLQGAQRWVQPLCCIGSRFYFYHPSMCTWSKALNCSQVLRNRSLRPLLTPVGNLSPYPKITCWCCCKFTHFRHHLTTSHEEVEVPALSMPYHVPVPVPCPPCSPGVCTWGCYGADVGYLRRSTLRSLFPQQAVVFSATVDGVLP
uniref:Arf-GAP domain-containing protein n=1 Tax=Papio anubis TaxID=9555 RepID=A0A8I5NL31_PAPAN